MPPLLREIVRETLAREPDLEVVAEQDAGVDVHTAVDEAAADFVILGTHASARSIAAVVGAGRRLRALELHANGRDGVLYYLRPPRFSLSSPPPAALVRTIRAQPTWDEQP